MKKVIIVAAILLTTGILTGITKETNKKTVMATKSAIVVEQNILATAD